MAKVIKCKLDADSIQNAIDELKAYRKSIYDKLEDLMNALLQDGSIEAMTRLGTTVGDSTNAVIEKTVPIKSGDKVVATICLVGKDCLFVEFGAGIYYNNGNAHPYAAEFGYGVGTYPSEHPPNRAIHPGYWWYKGADGAKHLSLGTQASMPIYYASEHMRNNAVARAVEVFRS